MDPSENSGMTAAAAAAAAAAQAAAASDSVLAQAAAKALVSVAVWLPDSFVIHAPNGGVVDPESGEAPPVLEANAWPPRPAQLHRAVWVQAQLAKARIERLVSKGLGALAALTAEVKHAYEEMDTWIEERIGAELDASESLVQVCLDSVISEQPVTEDWRLDGTELGTSKTYRLVAPPPAPVEPNVVPLYYRRLNPVQISHLQKGLHLAAAAEGFAESGQAALISTAALQDLLLRFAANDSDLPEYWSEEPASSNFEAVIEHLDPIHLGFVTTASVLDYFKHFE